MALASRAFMDMCALVVARVRVMPITPTPTLTPTLTRCGTRCHEALRELATGERGAHLASLLQAHPNPSPNPYPNPNPHPHPRPNPNP